MKIKPSIPLEVA